MLLINITFCHLFDIYVIFKVKSGSNVPTSFPHSTLSHRIIHQRIDIETMSDHGWPIPLTISSTKRVSRTVHRYKRSIRSSN